MMSYRLAGCFLALIICIFAGRGWAAEAAQTGKTITLFDGKSTDGWKMAGPGNFELKDGALVGHGGMGLYWFDKEFGDFILELDWMTTDKGANSGVFVRFPDPGNDPWVAVKKGHEIQICDTEAHWQTGAVYSFKNPTEIASKPAGEWNHFKIKVVGQHYTVDLNGKVVTEFDSPDRPLRGRIGIQNHPPDPPTVSFKNIKVTELPSSGAGTGAPTSQPKQSAIDPLKSKPKDLESGLVGQYFKGVNSLGDIKATTQPFLVRIDKNVNFRSVKGQFYKSKLATNFGVRWNGYITVEKAGPHTFSLRSDDESKLYLNDQLVIDNETKLEVGKEREKTVDLKPGVYALKLDYHQGPGGAACTLFWKRPGDDKPKPIAPEALAHAKGADAKIAWDKKTFDQTVWTRRAWAREFGETFDKMDYGPFFSASIAVSEKNVANKAVAISLTKADDATVCFDTQLLRYAGGWVGGFLDNHGVVFDGLHGVNPGPDGEVIFESPAIAGVSSGSTPDSQPRAHLYAPLPRDLGHYKGLYLNGEKVVLSYSAGGRDILETPSLKKVKGGSIFVRTIRAEASKSPTLLMVVGDQANIAVAVSSGAQEKVIDKAHWATIPPSDAPTTYIIAVAQKDAKVDAQKLVAEQPTDLMTLTQGGAARWNQVLETKGELGKDDGPYSVDTLTAPEKNPYFSWLRFGGLDFFSDGRAALTTWSGDVWIVSGIDDKLDHLKWKRYATGLFQPLGLRIVNDEVYALGRDQITRLKDLNGDGEADFYENFNNDVEVTPSFHEFAFDLQTDSEGNFYFAKAGPVRPGGRGWEILSAHNGTMMKVAKDGSKLEVFATGLRAPNGMCVGPNDVITIGDNEGTWTPACRLSLVKKGMFLGVVDLSKRDTPPTIYDKPICWLPHGDVDNSSGGQVWVTSDKWGALKDRLLHLSYGTCSLFLVDYETVDGQIQGGVVRLPLKFDTGICRARFNPIDSQLYVAGLRGWQTTATKDAALQRVRYTGKPIKMPTQWRIKEDGVQIAFSTELDSAAAADLNNYSVEQWNYLWSSDYGSPEFSVAEPKERGHDPVEVKKVEISPDKKSVKLILDEIEPVMQMKIQMKLKSADGSPMEYTIYNTINKVPGQPEKTAQKRTAATQAAATPGN